MVRAKKGWGQHWLGSRRLAKLLAAQVGAAAGDSVIEIGPGTGLLTRALLDRGADVTAIEVDPERAAQLRAELPGARFRVIEADVLQVPDTALPWSIGGVRLVGNLPYNLSGPILRWTSARRDRLQSVHFMLQLEVAERLCAAPGSRVYGALSVHMQWHFDATVLKRLSPGAFRPPPQVKSAFVRLVPLRDAADTRVPAALVDVAFRHRRKTLVRSLAAAGRDPEMVREALQRMRIRDDARPEMLSPEQWLALAERLGQLGDA